MRKEERRYWEDSFEEGGENKEWLLHEVSTLRRKGAPVGYSSPPQADEKTLFLSRSVRKAVRAMMTFPSSHREGRKLLGCPYWRKYTNLRADVFLSEKKLS